MSIASIRAALEAATEDLPEDALRAAVGQADQLAPEIATLLERAAQEEVLRLAEENLLFFGLHAVAAARVTSVCAPFVALLRGSELTLDRLFGSDWSDEAGPILMSVYDGNDAALRDLVLDSEAPDEARGLALEVLTRLVQEGRSDRGAMIELLDRYEREVPGDPGDAAWFDWQEAIVTLRLTDFTERVQRSWELGRLDFWGEEDRESWLEAIQTPEEPPPVASYGRLALIDDPVETLEWTRRNREWTPDWPGDLSPGELDWLDWVLLRPAISSEVKALEQADGYFTALLCGPVRPTYSERLWSDVPTEAILLRPELRDDVCRLMERHFRSIEQRLENGAAPKPFITEMDEDLAGSFWAIGFGQAIASDEAGWQPLISDRRGSELLGPIFGLMALPSAEEALSSKEREDALSLLPKLVVAIRHFWRTGSLPWDTPRRVGPKVGRNEPCPCGSGKKYKKCCGAVGARQAGELWAPG
jgi:yecA family protein